MAYSQNFDSSNQGAIHAQEKRSENAPDFRGEIEISGDVLNHIMRQAQAGQPVRVELAGWKRVGRSNGKPFVSLAVAIPYKERTEAPPQRQSTHAQVTQGFRNPTQQQRPPIQTSRGPYPQQGQQPQRPVTRPQTQQNQMFRDDLNDDFPPDFGGGQQSSGPWDD